MTLSFSRNLSFFVALFATVLALGGALAFLYRNEPHTFWAVIVALAGLIGAQIVFWIYTQPANAATNNWTSQPANWEVLRSQWEYSHAVGPGFSYSRSYPSGLGRLVRLVLIRLKICLSA
jgi:hypothetical protein